MTDEDLPFHEPWQAQAFAITMKLSQGGMFPWTEWVEVFSREIKANPQAADEDRVAAYYRQWLAALETILAAHGVAADEVADMEARWRAAYRNTPHGHPIELSAANAPHPEHDDEDDDDHDHHHHHGLQAMREPVAVSPATA